MAREMTLKFFKQNATSIERFQRTFSPIVAFALGRTHARVCSYFENIFLRTYGTYVPSRCVPFTRTIFKFRDAANENSDYFRDDPAVFPDASRTSNQPVSCTERERKGPCSRSNRKLLTVAFRLATSKLCARHAETISAD